MSDKRLVLFTEKEYKELVDQSTFVSFDKLSLSANERALLIAQGVEPLEKYRRRFGGSDISILAKSSRPKVKCKLVNDEVV